MDEILPNNYYRLYEDFNIASIARTVYVVDVNNDFVTIQGWCGNFKISKEDFLKKLIHENET